MNQDRLQRMTKKQLIKLIWRMAGWLEYSALWEEEDIRWMFNMEDE